MRQRTAGFRRRPRGLPADDLPAILAKWRTALARQERFQRHLDLTRLVVCKLATFEQAVEYVNNWHAYLALREEMETWYVDEANFMKVAYDGTRSPAEIVAEFGLDMSLVPAEWR